MGALVQARERMQALHRASEPEALRALIPAARVSADQRERIITRGAASSRRVFDASSLPLSPGMSAQVEVITGERSVLSYILSPIARATGEAGRER